jgi:hypothetical protein
LIEVQDIIEACSGLFTEATTAQQMIAQGDIMKLNFFLNNRSNTPVVLQHISIEAWDTTINNNLSINQNLSINHILSVPANKHISQPYWLEYPIQDGSFDVRDQTLIGKAENDAAYQVIYTVTIGGESFTINRPVQYKVVDPAKGELYQPIAIIPRMELNYTKDNYVSINGAPVKADVHFKSNVKDSVLYKIKQHYTYNWKYSESVIN